METNLLRLNFSFFRKLLSHYKFANLNEGSERALSTLYSFMGGRPQAASLVQGLRPRNAPLQNHPSPTLCAHSSRAAPAACLANSVSPPTCRLNPPTIDR